MKELIAYFSRNGENYVSGELKILEIGNTEVVAHTLQKITNADLFKIDPQITYSNNYNDCIEAAAQDQRSNARPALSTLPDNNMEDYDVIYLGYPNYWGTMPMIVFTFLELFDFTEKTIYPFCTHEGSGFGTSIQDIKLCCPSARIKDGLALHGSHSNNIEPSLKNWLKNKT